MRVRAALDWWDGQGGEPTDSLAGTGAIAHLEHRLAEWHGQAYGIAVGSATSGLRALLQCAGIGPGDEVLIPSLDWTAALAVARDLGVTPVPVPVDDRLGMDVARARASVTPRTRCIIATHVLGLPAQAAALRQIADECQLLFIEDTSHSVGAMHRSRPVGSFGHAAVCSLGDSKPVSGGEGGVITTSDDDLFDRLITMTQHPLRHLICGVKSDASPSIPTRIHPVAAIIALHHMDSLPHRLSAQRQRHRRINELLRDRDGVHVVNPDPGDSIGGSGTPIWANAAFVEPTLHIAAHSLVDIAHLHRSGRQVEARNGQATVDVVRLLLCRLRDAQHSDQGGNRPARASMLASS
jgi:dTDP-4-amino-4,6-dideoxygalactose transaminase